MSILAHSRRWLFAFLVLFTASQYEIRCTSTQSSSSSASTSLFAAALDKPFYTTPPFSKYIIHRTPVCDRFAQYAGGERDLRDLLEGLELSVGIVDQGNDIFLRLNRTDPDRNNWYIKEEDPGIFVRILDELAARGKFTWRNSFAWVQPPNTTLLNNETGKNFTWTDVLLDAVTRYDFSFAEWVHNQERRKLGISFPVGWFDASTILVQNQVQTVPTFEYTSFLRPFSTEVWYLVCAVIFFTGVVYWTIDKIEYPNDKINTVVYDTFLTTLTVTQHHQYWDPSTHGKRIFGYSAAFWAVLLASSYTANLASFLVAQSKPVIWAQTLQEVEQKKIKLCVRAGAAVYSQVTSTFPGISLQLEKDFDQVYASLREGKCQMMASRAADFDAFKNDQTKNPGCSLEWVGRAQFINKGGPGTLVDTSEYCTSVIRHVLDLHMHEMISEGRIDYFWKQHLRSLDNYKLCAGGGIDAVQTLDGDYALQVTDLGGAFVFHAALITIAFIVTLIESPWRRKRRRKKAELLAAEKGEDDADYVDNYRPSIERLQSVRSMRNLAGAEMVNFYQMYNDNDDSFDGTTAESRIRDSIRRKETYEIPADGLLRSLEMMQAQVDLLQMHADTQSKRSSHKASRLDEIEEDPDEKPTEKPANPNEGK